MQCWGVEEAVGGRVYREYLWEQGTGADRGIAELGVWALVSGV